MTELTYEVPTVGEKHRASDSRVTTALTEIRTVLNGRLTGSNFAKETITPKKFAPPEKWKIVEFGKTIEPGQVFEVNVGAVNRIVLITLIIEVGIPAASFATVSVEGVVIAKVKQPGGALKPATMTVGPFRVMAGETWAFTNSSSGTPAIGKKSTYAYLREVI